MRRFIISSIVIILLLYQNVFSIDSKENNIKKASWELPISISIISEAVSIPFGNITPLHPGGIIGSELKYYKDDYSYVFQTLNLGYYYHYLFQAAVFLNSEIAYRLSFNFGLQLESFLGIGYLHSFNANPVYVQDANGEYKKTLDLGYPRFIATFAFGIGYDLGRIGFFPISLFIRYQFLLEMPFSKESPFLPHTIFSIGVRYCFKV